MQFGIFIYSKVVIVIYYVACVINELYTTALNNFEIYVKGISTAFKVKNDINIRLKEDVFVLSSK